MKITVLTFALLIFLTINLPVFAQLKTIRYETKTVTNSAFFLNSGTRIGGRPRLCLPLKSMPKNTVKWLFAFTTTQNEHEKKSPGFIDFATKAISNPKAELAKIALSSFFPPTGAAIVDVYLTTSEHVDAFYEKDFLGVYENHKPTSYKAFTRENSTSATVEVEASNLLNNDVCLCFRNPSQSNGVNVNLEVLAIVKKVSIDNTQWSEESLKLWRDGIYKWIIENYKMSKTDAFEIADLMVETIAEEYTPDEFEALPSEVKQEYLVEMFKDYKD